MVHVTVQYDAETRTFKLVDEASNVILEGDALYDLAIPMTADEAYKAARNDARARFVAEARHLAYNSRN